MPVPDRLSHVYWIGGASGAGKSTIARLIAERAGATVYSTDDAMREHVERLRPDDAPLLSQFLAMDMDERWLTRSPQTMLDTFQWFAGEGFGLIVEDLLAMPTGQPVIAEGFRLLPRLVGPLLGRSRQAVWLVPSPEFRLRAFGSRGTTWAIAEQTSDPHAALGNLMNREAMFTEIVRTEADGLGLPVIAVDVGMSEGELVALAAGAVGL